MAYYSEQFIYNLEEIASGLRLKSLEMIYRRGAGHPGGCLSAADSITALYFHKMHIDPAHPNDADRDRFILSKGYASAVLHTLKHLDVELVCRCAQETGALVTVEEHNLIGGLRPEDIASRAEELLLLKR